MGDLTSSQQLGAFVADSREAPAPESLRQRACEVLLDGLGVMIAGAREPLVESLVAALSQERGPSTLVGRTERAPSMVAVTVNAAAGRALELDDIQSSWWGHPTSVLLPAALAIAERGRLSGRELVHGYLVGLAVGDALGTALGVRPEQQGWLPTGTIGGVAAAAACAYLLGCDGDQAGHAIAIAASGAAGLPANRHTPAAALHAGWAARSGVSAALTALHGVTASPDALDGPGGFAETFGSAGLSADDLAAVLDPTFAGPLDRIASRRYPLPPVADAPLEAALSLRQDRSFAPHEIERVDCVVDPYVRSVLNVGIPSTTMEARFSLPYGLAVALLHGEVGLEHFTPGAVADPHVLSVASRVRIHAYPQGTTASEYPCSVMVTAVDGQVHTVHVSLPWEGMTDRLTRAEVVDRVRMLAGLGQRTPLTAVAERVLTFDECADVSTWTTALREASS